MAKMDDKQRLQLEQMISENNVDDQTDLIRDLKHSHILRADVSTLLMLKSVHKDDIDKLNLAAISECNFLFTYYSSIYHKIRKDEIDLEILNNFLNVLEKIEDGKIDQHEGSYEIGQLLKTIYVDSALRKAEKINEETGKPELEFKGPQVDVSWLEFKRKSNK